jgi:hypothetical protein
MDLTTSNSERYQKLDHDVIWFDGKKIVVCCGHCCDRHGEVVND